MGPTHYDSLSPHNKFQFTCPLFDAKTSMGNCMRLRDIAYTGKPFEKRLGCQAAVKCGKCPAAVLATMYAFNKGWNNDHHGSREPKEGKLHAQVLDRILPVMIQDKVMDRLGVPTAERMLLTGANERIQKQLMTAPGEVFAKSDFAPSTKRRSKPAAAPKPKANDKLMDAAARGDIAAAINA